MLAEGGLRDLLPLVRVMSAGSTIDFEPPGVPVGRFDFDGIQEQTVEAVAEDSSGETGRAAHCGKARGGNPAHPTQTVKLRLRRRRCDQPGAALCAEVEEHAGGLCQFVD